MSRTRIAAWAVSLLFAACSPVRFVTPIPAEHYAASASLGGPLITFSGATIPMPLTSLAAGYGLSSNTSLFAGLHTTALLFHDIQLDIGALRELLPQDGWRPGVSASAVANLALALRDGSFKFWPELNANAYWHYMSNGNLLYVGSSNWFELASTRSDGESQPQHWVPNLQCGHVFDGENWQYTTEIKYLAVGVMNLPSVVEYHGLSGNGSFGVYLALTRKF